MKRYIYLIILTGAILLSGCTSSQPATVKQTSIPPASSVATTSSQIEPTPAADAEIDFCTQCHTDKDALVQNAKPLEVKVKESEGVG